VRLSRQAILIFTITTLIGACLHFAYDLFPSPLTALISPVRESIWEHLKLVFWPGIAAQLYLQGREGGNLSARLLSLVISCAGLLLAGYVYHFPLAHSIAASHTDSLGVDIGLYVVTMAVVFVLPGLLDGKHLPSLRMSVCLAAVLGVMLVVFTYLPPNCPVFADLSGVHTWFSLPC